MAASPQAVFEHTKHPEWGRAVVIEALADRKRYLFEDGKERVFLNDNPAVIQAGVSDAERDAIIQRVLHRKPTKRHASSQRRPRPEESLTFAKQEEIFRGLFPLGFEDPKYVFEERGTESGSARYKDAAIRLAHETLTRAELDALIDSDRASEVFERAVRVVRATKNLLYPMGEKQDFEGMPPEAHPAFARALRALLYGTGDYAPRFDAFASALAMKRPTWPAATLLSAVVHPTDHVFVKATFGERQARILRLHEPPREVTGSGYAQHLAVARALEQQLVAAGHKPRDLFDVYTFGWITQRQRA